MAKRNALDRVRKLALKLPDVVESTSYGTLAFKRKIKSKLKLFVRALEDGKRVVVLIDMNAREDLIRAAPEKFGVTDHYLRYPWVIVTVDAVSDKELAKLLENAHASA